MTPREKDIRASLAGSIEYGKTYIDGVFVKEILEELDRVRSDRDSWKKTSDAQEVSLNFYRKNTYERRAEIDSLKSFERELWNALRNLYNQTFHELKFYTNLKEVGAHGKVLQATQDAFFKAAAALQKGERK